jgi:general stress protein 26
MMNDDLVKRLRNRAESWLEYECEEDAKIDIEAADRIEELEARLKLTEDRLKKSEHWVTHIRRWVETGELPR